MKVKKIFLSASIIGSVAILSSCSSRPQLEQTSQIKYRDVTGVVKHIPVTADLDVKSTRIQGVYEERASTDGKGKEKKLVYNVEACKSQAIADALDKSGADILIEPIFSINVIKNKVTVRVSGYPGYYKNFRPATLKDKELLEIDRFKPEERASSSSSTLISR